jgi:predicted PurR-regulated permease PerM
LIALCNTIITLIGFYLIGLIYGWFPYLLTMGLIVFFASFIPILWMWISAIPLSIIGYIHWWFDAMFLVLLMIILTTAFEVYFLNPKIVSSLFKLPVSLTFVILFVSEQFFGIAWLLIWVSLFYFIISLLGDFDKLISQGQKRKEKV